MTINSVSMPKVLDYYISPKYKELLNEKFVTGHCEIDRDKLYLVIDYDPDLFACLKLYIDKTEKITLGNVYKYEYEHDVKEFSGDKDFVIYLEDGAHICELDSSNMDNENIVIIFKLK